MINAAFILGAMESKYPRAVMVPELSINDPYWHDWDHRPSPDKRLDGHKPIRRIDALMFDSYQRTAIEVKVSAADYSLDTHQKRRPWQRVTHRFIYAVPYHLKVMAPHGCGLWKIHNDGSIEVVKRPSSINILSHCHKMSCCAWPIGPPIRSFPSTTCKAAGHRLGDIGTT